MINTAIPGPVSLPIFTMPTVAGPPDVPRTTARQRTSGTWLDSRPISKIRPVPAADRSPETGQRVHIRVHSLLSRQEQLNYIDENTGNIDLSYKCDYQLWGLDHSLQLGLDLMETDYVREEKSTADRHNSLIRTTGIFVLSRWSLPKNLTLQAGYRRSSL